MIASGDVFKMSNEYDEIKNFCHKQGLQWKVQELSILLLGPSKQDYTNWMHQQNFEPIIVQT